MISLPTEPPDSRWGPTLDARLRPSSRGLLLVGLLLMCADPSALAADDPATDGTVIGRHYLDAWRETCRVWDVQVAPDTPPEPRPHEIPTLIITGDVDPVTPPAYGDRIAAVLPNSPHRVILGRGHTGGDLTNQDCFADVLADFVEACTLEGLDTACLATMKPPPFPTDEVHTRLTWISVAPGHKAAWKSAMGKLARVLDESTEASFAYWLVYRAQPSGYLVVSFGERDDGVLPPIAVARRMKHLPGSEDFRAAIEALDLSP